MKLLCINAVENVSAMLLCTASICMGAVHTQCVKLISCTPLHQGCPCCML